MNFDYFFRLTPVAMGIQQMLKEHYGTDLTISQEVRWAQFEDYFSTTQGPKDEPSTRWH